MTDTKETKSDPVEALRALVEAADHAAIACNTGMMDEAIENARAALQAADAAGLVVLRKEELSNAWAIADGDLDFAPPLRFEFAQGSDQTGEYYTRVAKFVDANGTVIMDITHDGDWVDTQMHAIAAVLSIVRRLQAASRVDQGKEQGGE